MFGLARATGLEPATSGVTGRRSNQLNYARNSPKRRARDIGPPIGCQAYRTREEVEKIRSEKDAIEHVRDLLLNAGLASDEDLKAIDREIKEQVNASAEFAKDSPEPALAELWTDIYA